MLATAPTPPAVSAFVASIAFVLALATFVVAFRQYRTARQNLRLNLFDKRWKIYQATGDLLVECLTNTEPEPVFKALLAFRYTTNGRKFLLPDKINNWIDSVEEHAKETHKSNMDIVTAADPDAKKEAFVRLHDGKAVSKPNSQLMNELEPTFSEIMNFRNA